jgi:hypothetical protein
LEEIPAGQNVWLIHGGVLSYYTLTDIKLRLSMYGVAGKTVA